MMHLKHMSLQWTQWRHAHLFVAQPFACDERALETQGSCDVSAGGSDSLDEDIIDILPRLLSSSPLRMLCLQHTGTLPRSLPACSFLLHAAESHGHRLWQQAIFHQLAAAMCCANHTVTC